MIVIAELGCTRRADLERRKVTTPCRFSEHVSTDRTQRRVKKRGVRHVHSAIQAGLDRITYYQ